MSKVAKRRATAKAKAANRAALPMPDPPFRGEVGKTYKESKENWPELPKAPKGALIDVLIAKPGDGVLLAEGGQSAGFVLYIKDGKPCYHYNYFEIERTSIQSAQPLPSGPCKVSFEFRYDGGGGGRGGEAVLLLNDEEVGKKRFEHTVAGRFGIDAFGVGCDTGSPVCKDYKPPFTFKGQIEKVEILRDQLLGAYRDWGSQVA